MSDARIHDRDSRGSDNDFALLRSVIFYVTVSIVNTLSQRQLIFTNIIIQQQISFRESRHRSLVPFARMIRISRKGGPFGSKIAKGALVVAATI